MTCGVDGPHPTHWFSCIAFHVNVPCSAAGVPGMVGGMTRHLRSLRRMQHDQGWINTLLAEAENERMHLLTFMELKRPSALFRAMVLLAQVGDVMLLLLCFLLCCTNSCATEIWLPGCAIAQKSRQVASCRGGCILVFGDLRC